MQPRPIHERRPTPRDLELLTQALDSVAAELRELVEEQHPVVRRCSGMSPDGRSGDIWLQEEPVSSPRLNMSTKAQSADLRGPHRNEIVSSPSPRLRTSRCASSRPPLEGRGVRARAGSEPIPPASIVQLSDGQREPYRRGTGRARLPLGAAQRALPSRDSGSTYPGR